MYLMEGPNAVIIPQQQADKISIVETTMGIAAFIGA
jgi:hypothetical protein